MRIWVCICDCGKQARVLASSLNSGNTSSCGCRRDKSASESLKTHGMSKTPEYYVYRAMLQRCGNKRNPRYKDYGGRGIAVCDRWLDGFEAFLEDMGNRPAGMSIERVNNDLGYFKENCKWATMKEQSLNKRPPIRKKESVV